MKSRNPKALEELEDLISEISEAAFFAGWMIGIEFEIWECATSDRRRLGQVDLTEAQVARLQELGRICGGWMFHPVKEGGPRRVDGESWAQVYRRWKEGATADELIAELERGAP